MPGFRTLDGGVTWEAYAMPLGAEVGEVTLAEDGAVYFWGDDRLYTPAK